MSDKRFVIKPSSIVTDCFVIIDKEKKYTFPVLESTLNYMFCKALNGLNDENEQLRKENKKLHETMYRTRYDVYDMRSRTYPTNRKNRE